MAEGVCDSICEGARAACDGLQVLGQNAQLRSV
jgi:hypothetical protein